MTHAPDLCCFRSLHCFMFSVGTELSSGSYPFSALSAFRPLPCGPRSCCARSLVRLIPAPSKQSRSLLLSLSGALGLCGMCRETRPQSPSVCSVFSASRMSVWLFTVTISFCHDPQWGLLSPHTWQAETFSLPVAMTLLGTPPPRGKHLARSCWTSSAHRSQVDLAAVSVEPSACFLFLRRGCLSHLRCTGFYSRP